MGDQHLDRLELLFRAARQQPVEDREAFLAAACADDDPLRKELLSLLEADAVDDGSAFVDVPANEVIRASGPTQADDPPDEEVIGPYRVLRRIGSGGMGDVYLGLREEPFKRYVALKVLRSGTETREIAARFAVERQILAALSHPNIGRLLDGGTTEKGRPYFAMEYVDGLSLTRYCDQHRLSIPERLQLFSTVCRAVHYAHQNLVIHRDLKPSNILVMQGGVVKLLDFGIAKLLNPHLSPQDLPITRSDLRLMTPEYASPEQVRGETLTTAADIYSLGVILYDLLCGHKPYLVRSFSTHDIIETVCESKPERPSVRIAEAEPMPDEESGRESVDPALVGEARSSTTERLRKLLRGDLDNVALMALRKEPERRYSSAEQFRQDIDRYLEGLPVMARPSTLGYRTRKFVRRHRAVVVAASMAVLSLVAGLSASLWQAGRAGRERDRAQVALGRSETVTNFLINLFQANDPGVGNGIDITARELLARGVERTEALEQQPELQAHLLDVVGRVYSNLGQYETAQELLERSLLRRRNEPVIEPLILAETMNALGFVLTQRGIYAEGRALLEEALGLETGDTDEARRSRIATLNQLAYLLPYMGEWAETEKIYREVLDMQRLLVGTEHPDVANALIKLGAVLRSEGQYDDSERIFREALAMHRRLQPEYDPNVLGAMFQLAILLREKKQYDEVEALLRRAIELKRSKDSAFDRDLSSYMFELGEILAFQGKMAEAETTIVEALEIRRETMGEDHPSTADGIYFLAGFRHLNGELDEARRLCIQVLEMRRRLLGPQHQEVAVVLRRLGAIEMDAGNFSAAESLLTEAYQMHLRVNGPNHHHVGQTLGELADLYRRTGRPDEAEPLYQEGLAILRTSHTDEHNSIQTILAHLADLYDAQGDGARAGEYRALLVQR